MEMKKKNVTGLVTKIYPLKIKKKVRKLPKKYEKKKKFKFFFCNLFSYSRRMFESIFEKKKKFYELRPLEGRTKFSRFLEKWLYLLNEGPNQKSSENRPCLELNFTPKNTPNLPL